MTIENIRDHGEITKQVITLDADRITNETLARAAIRAVVILSELGKDPGALPEIADFFLTLNEALTDGAPVIEKAGKA